MDQAARTRAAREGRTYRPYQGGPVDWHTGDPGGADPAVLGERDDQEVRPAR